MLKYISYLFTLIIVSNSFTVLASTSRIIDFNNTSDLRNYFNGDGTATYTNKSFGDNDILISTECR